MQGLIDRLTDALALAKLVGQAPAFLRSIETLPRVARSEAPVLIRGETGTGKELVARAVHYLSPRSGQPFIAVNCGSLPDTLLEDELFGHERGAFTDARARRPGLVALADKGTLFLDEVDSLTRKAQVSLLRVLQEKRFRPVGAAREQDADVRVLAATNSSLDRLVRAGGFREDLFYRLCVFSVHLPPLRERPEDVRLLACHFLAKHAAAGRPARCLARSALDALAAHDWPGNVRELENAMIRAGHLCLAEDIEAEDLGLPAAARPGPGPGPSRADGLRDFKGQKRQTIEQFERNYLLSLMGALGGNVSDAARVAGKERRDLGKLLKKYGIDPRSFRAPGPASSP